jgi:hypothetical protein
MGATNRRPPPIRKPRGIHSRLTCLKRAEADMQANPMATTSTMGVYDESKRRIRATCGDNYARLAAIKKRYDPTNMFRLNANIKPA